MNNYKNELTKQVHNAYTKLSKNRKTWPNKYNRGLQLSKWLSDYALLSEVDLHGKKILNIGCSEPVDEIFWVDLVEEWCALDINENLIRVARNMALEVLPPHLFSKLRFIVGDATNLNIKDEYFNVVVSFSAIDHIPGKEQRIKAVNEMWRVLKTNGHLVITVPNRWDAIYSYRSNKLQRKNKSEFGYEYQFSPFELKHMLISNGFKIIDCASTSFNPYSYFDIALRKIRLHKAKIYFGRRLGFLAQKI